MNRKFSLVLCLLAHAAGWGLVSTARAGSLPPPNHGVLPLAFEAGGGPADTPAEFLARGRNYALFLETGGGAVLCLSPGAGGPQHGDVVRMSLSGARPDGAGSAQNELPGRVNYFIGNNPAGWRRGIRTFARVKFGCVYPGVDLVYYGNEGQLEYDFWVAPHADAGQIALKFDSGTGVPPVRLLPAGELQIALSADSHGRDARATTVRWQHPVAWQDIGGRRVSVACEYALETRRQDACATTVRFRLGDYDHTQPLVIDPVLLYSTYLGGASSSGDSAQAVTTDAAGNVYFTGSAGSYNFPNTRGQFISGSSDAFVTKLDSTGTNLLFSTFIGGTGSDSGQALTLDGSGHVFIAGSASPGFPITNGFQTATANGFLAELSADGSNVLYSTYIADSVRGVGADGSGNVVVAGTTSLANFPVTPGVLRTNPPSGVYPCGFVVKVNPALSGTNSLVYSTLFGGSGYDSIEALAVNAAGDAYLTGAATSTNFPVTPGAFQTDRLGYSDVFVAELNTTGTALVFSTLLGGSGGEDASYYAGIALDPDGNVYVTGQTGSKDFPTTSGAAQRTFGGGGQFSSSGDAFVAKFNPAGTALLWSTYLGGSLDDNGTGLTVDSNRNVYVTGNTTSLNFPTRQPLYPPNLVDAFKFAAGATNWTGLSIGSQTINVFAVDPVNSSNVYAGATRTGTEPVLYKSPDAGLTWMESDAGLPANFSVYDSFSYQTIQASIKALTVDPSNPNVLYAGFGSGAGIYKSTNAGANWVVITNGLPPLLVVVYGGVDQAPVNALAVDPHNSQNVFAAVGSSAQSGGVFRSANGGLTWSNVLSGSFEAVAFDPADSLNVYAANNNYGGFYKSTDGGNTWTNLNSGLPGSSPVQCLAVNPASPSVIYAGIGGYYGGGIYASTNAGTNWSVTGQSFGSVASIVFNPGNPNTLYAGYGVQSYGYGVLVSTNAGTNWTSMNAGMSTVSGNDYVNNLAADPLHPGTLYAASEEYVQEGFAAQLDASGSLLVYGTYLGGVTGTFNSRANNYANGVAVDNAGNAWVVGNTTTSDFPVTTNAYQQSYLGYQSAFFAKLGSAASADIAVALVASTNQTPANTSFSYTVTVTNRGPADATAVTLEDALPAPLALQSAVLSQGSYQLAGQTLTCNFGTVTNGTSAVLTLTVTPSLAGAVQNTVSATANETDPVLSNNVASVTTTVQQNSALHTDLALGASVSPNPALLGYNLNYVLSVTNLGPDAASGVILTDALPASVTVVSATTSQGTVTQLGKNLTATFGNLAAGAGASLNLVVTPQSRGSITNSAGVTGNESDPNPANNFAVAATQVIAADLQVTRSGPVPEQADQSFTVAVTNVGPDAVANTVLTITSPDGTNTVLTSAAPSQGSAVISNNLVVASLGTIPVGAGAAVHIAASGPANVFAYTLVSQASSSGVVLFTQTNSTVADLAIHGVATPNPSVAGETVTLTGLVTNNGPDVAKRVVVLIGLDATTMTLLSMNAATGTTSTFPYGSILYVQDIIPVLNPGTSAQLTVQVQAYKAPLDLALPFGADSDQPDPTPQDNSIFNIYTPPIRFTDVVGQGVVSFGQANYAAAENSAAASISVIRQGGSTGTVSVAYSTTGGSAVSGANYSPVSGTLTFAPGETAKTFMVPLQDDGIFSPDVSVNLGLSGVTGGFLGAPANATLTINESDFPTNPVGNLRLVSAAITNSPLIFGNNPYPYGTPRIVALTPDGRHVLFNSIANNLANGINNTFYNGFSDAQEQNVFVHDMNTNFVTLVNVTPAGGVGNAAATGDAITPDGRFVVFDSSATDLTPGNDGGNNQIFVRDLVSGQTKLVSLGTNGFSGGGGYSYGAKISDDGRHVFFTSYAHDLVPQPTTGSGDVFMRDTWSNVTTLVSVSTNGTAGSDNGAYLDGITPDGRFVVFNSYMVVTNSTYINNIFVRDTVAGTTVLVSVNPAGTQSGSSSSSSPGITPDGKFVVFASVATNLTADVITNGNHNIFLRNLVAGNTVLVSVGTNGLAGTGSSSSPTISSNGQFVAFGSYAYNLSPLHTNISEEEVFVRDVVNGTNRLVSVDFAGTNSAGSYAQKPQMTPDGRFVVFDSGATDLTTNQGIGYDNVFVADLVSNTMTLASANTNGGASTGATQEQVTPDGRYVAFESSDDTLALGAPYFTGEIYRRDLGGGGALAATAPVSATFSRTANNSSPATAFSMSANGRWIAFDSYALNLVQNQTNGNGTLFLADTLSNTLTLLNLNTNGALPDYSAYGPQISADGNVVAFISQASDLVANPVNNYIYNVFAYNLTNGTMNLVSVNRSGGSDNGSSALVGLSPDGRYIVFTSYATNLTAVTLTNNYWQHLYVRDLLGGTTVMVDVTATNGLPGDSNAGTGSITPDGRFVAFTSASDWLVPGVSNVTGSFQDYQIYLRDLVAGTNTLVSATPSGGPTTNEFGVYYSQPVISADGRYVVFGSSSLDLLAGNTNTAGQIYQRDLHTGQTRLVSVNFAGTSGGNGYAGSSLAMTPDGRYVVFTSYASDLTPNADTNNTGDVFVRDTVGGTTTLVSVNDTGAGTANAVSDSAVISADGRYVTFRSFATDLVPGAFSTGVGNIYRRDLVNGVTLLISGNLAGTGGGSGTSERPAMSADGSVIAFDSAAYDLTPQDLNQANDLFVFGFVSVSNTADLALGVTAPASASIGNNFSLTLTVTNLGPTNASGVAVVDTLPPGVSFVSANASQGTPVFGGGQVTCAVGGLASGASATVAITVKPIVAGLIYNDASVSGNQADLNPYNNSAQTAVTVSGSSAPVLAIGRLSGNQLQISWPITANLELQTTTNLAPPVVWQPLTNGIVSGGGVSSLVVTNLPGGANHFYRLATPP